MPFTMRRNHQTSNEVWRRHAFPCAYDAVNQLVTSTDADGKVTEYAYDAVGRMVKEGTKTYRYGYLDKVLAVTEGKARYIYGYHVDGQLASATKTMSGKAGGAQSPATEVFYWDGLALVKRGITSYVNEPHPGGGAAVFSSKDGVMFNDILGTTLGTQSEHGYASVAMTAFGDTADADALFTGKPLVDGLGHAFLLRNYRAGLGKWLTIDPLGYPDGWNQLAYCNNWVTDRIDWLGFCSNCQCPTIFNNGANHVMGREGVFFFNPSNSVMNAIEDYFPYAHYFAVVHDSWVDRITSGRSDWVDWAANIPTMPAAYVFAFSETNYERLKDMCDWICDLFKAIPQYVCMCYVCLCKE